MCNECRRSGSHGCSGPELSATAHLPDTVTVSGEQLGTLRCRVSLTTVTDPDLLYEAFDTTYGKKYCASRDSDNGFDGSATCAAEPVRMRIYTIQADAAFGIDACHQSQVRGNDTRERIRRGDHEHDDHLQPRGLLCVCAI
jgi:hypothetical protein